ncbi:MAG: hypothetical protein GKS04_02670 [Candidatus Mycalebacterium zealandia]|nr:MAG: hypothetical protein GKS04_02670 [Candidatus Mycalebacterium zealandia]
MTEKNNGANYIEIPGDLSGKFENTLKNSSGGAIVKRLWERDLSLWKGDADLIANRLGWLSLPENTAHSLEKIRDFAARLKDGGIKNVILIAMGGSGLISKVFARAFADSSDTRLTVIDTTVADTIARVCENTNWNETFFIVSSKSGATVETVSAAAFFFERCSEKLGADEAAQRFAAITDENTPLFESASERGFAEIFTGDKTVGGRFSPLSVFGMVPAAIAGADVDAILSSARDMARELRGENDNTALNLAGAIDFFSKNGNGAFHIRCSEAIAGFDRFVEQIVGESLGKDGMRVLPAVHPVETDCGAGGAFFVCLKDDEKLMAQARAVAESGMPIVITVLENKNALGGEIFRWEVAVAILGALWGINPFDQPDVESAKEQARRLMEIYRREGKLPLNTADFTHGKIEFRTSVARSSADLRAYFEKKAKKKKSGVFFSIQAFLDGSDEKLRDSVESLRASLAKTFGVTVTADWGPAYLHSSGQIHKGDAGDGIFIQLCGKCNSGIKIPGDTPVSGGVEFEILKNAQMLGDREALENVGREVVQIDLNSDPAGAIAQISKLLKLTLV